MVEGHVVVGSIPTVSTSWVIRIAAIATVCKTGAFGLQRFESSITHLEVMPNGGQLSRKQ